MLISRKFGSPTVVSLPQVAGERVGSRCQSRTLGWISFGVMENVN